MISRSPNLMTALACAILLGTPGRAPAAQSRTTAVVLHVDNYARIPPSVLIRASEEVRRIYASAGLRTVWIIDNEPAESLQLADARHLRVLLLCQEMSDRKIAADGVATDVLGQAGYVTGRAYVFVPRVMQAALLMGRDADLVLGRVLAHEIGHLLLARPGHGRKGLMRPGLDFRSRAADKFTAAERDALKLALAIRPRT
jgi:hypothetical protein